MKKAITRKTVVWIALASLLLLFLFSAVLWISSTDRPERMLAQAAWSGNTIQAKLLVWCGADPNVSPHGTSGALHGAAASGNIKLMRFLLDHGAEVDAPMIFGITPLWEARQNDQDEAEKL